MRSERDGPQRSALDPALFQRRKQLGQGGGWSKVTGRVAVGNILGVAEMSTHRKGWEEGRRTPGPQGLSEMESRAVALGRPCCG